MATDSGNAPDFDNTVLRYADLIDQCKGPVQVPQANPRYEHDLMRYVSIVLYEITFCRILFVSLYKRAA